MPTERERSEWAERALEHEKVISRCLMEEIDRLQGALAIAESTRDSAQASSTRDLLDARNMRRIFNAPTYEAKALADVSFERRLQDSEHGPVSGRLGIPMGTGGKYAEAEAFAAREMCNRHVVEGTETWRHILTEEFWEAMSETDPVKLRAELVQVAAVSVAAIEVLDRLAAGEKP